MFKTIRKGKLLYNAGVEAVREYRDGAIVKKNTPSVMFLVAPFMMPFAPIEIISEDMGGLIQSYTFNKSRSAAGGQVTIEIAADERTNRFFGDLLESKSPLLNDIWSKFGVDLRDIFKPMSYCQVWRDGYHVFSGYITSCIRHAKPGNSTYTVTAEELGCILQGQILSFSTIEFGVEQCIMDSPTTILQAANRQIGLPLPTAIMAYIIAYNATTLAYPGGMMRMSDGLPLSMRLIALQPPLGAISASSIYAKNVADTSIFNLGQGQSFWDFLRGLAPEPFMEFFTESGGRTIVTGRMIPRTPSQAISAVSSGAISLASVNMTPMLPGFNYVVARTAPYDVPWIGATSWSPLIYGYTLGVLDLLLGGDFIIVTDADIVSKSLGTSGNQQYTAFVCNYGSHGGANPGGRMTRPSLARGAMNPLSSGGLRTYGFREFQASVNVLSLDWSGLTGQVIEQAERPVQISIFSTLLNYWFRNAGKFNEGIITVRGMPYARPGMYLLYLPSYNGQKVDNPRDLGIYYIDNVQDNYSIGRADTTTINVIRGVPIPTSAGNIMRMLFDWEILPPTPNIVDGEVRWSHRQV